MTSLSEMIQTLRNAYAYRHEPEQMRLLAILYWRGLLGFSLILFACALLLGVYVFAYVGSVQAPVKQDGASAALLDRAALESVLEAFDARATAYGSLKTATPIADPSK